MASAVENPNQVKVTLSITTTRLGTFVESYASSVTNGYWGRVALKSLSKQQLTLLIPQLEKLLAEMSSLLDDQNAVDNQGNGNVIE